LVQNYSKEILIYSDRLPNGPSVEPHSHNARQLMIRKLTGLTNAKKAMEHAPPHHHHHGEGTLWLAASDIQLAPPSAGAEHVTTGPPNI
jgi:hypothetical protein